MRHRSLATRSRTSLLLQGDDRRRLPGRTRRSPVASRAMEDWLASPKSAQGRRRRRVRGGAIEISSARSPGSRSSAARTIRTTPRRSPTWLAPRSMKCLIGSCMTNIGHFRAAAKLLGRQARSCRPNCGWHRRPRWTPAELTEEGHYNTFGTAGARMEMPGCSAVRMGNQAQIKEGATAMSTSTRNFPNRLGKSTNVYLAAPSWRQCVQARSHPDQGGIPRRHRRDQRRRQQDLLHMNFNEMPGLLSGRGIGRRVTLANLRTAIHPASLVLMRNGSCRNRVLPSQRCAGTAVQCGRVCVSIPLRRSRMESPDISNSARLR